MTPRVAVSLLWALAVAGPALAQSEVIIFDSLGGGPLVNGVVLSHDLGETSSSSENTALPPNGSENWSQIGQRLNLTGAARRLTRLDLRFGSIGSTSHPVSYDNIIRIFDVGADGLPANLLWTGIVTGITFTTGPSTNRVFSATLFPDVDLPNSIFLTSAEDNIIYPTTAPGAFGIAWQPNLRPRIGGTGLYAAQTTTTGLWARETSFDTLPSSSLEARLTAIPAPNPAACSLVALVVVATRRRRRV